MFETRIDSAMRKMQIQEAKRVAVDPSPNKASDQMSCLPGLGLAAAQIANLQATSSISEETIAIDGIMDSVCHVEGCLRECLLPFVNNIFPGGHQFIR